MKILCCYGLEWEKDYLKQKLPNCEIVFVQGSTRDCPKKVDASIEALCVFINSPVSAEFLAQFPQLKFIATRSTGIDHIDLRAAQKNNIVVSSVPAYGKCCVAEYTLGLMLNLSRRIYQACQLPCEGKFFASEMIGFDLMNSTLGVIGTGAIGIRVVQLARAFGMNVLACDTRPNQPLASEFGFSYVTLEQLLSQAHVVTLHVNYNKSTHHLINRENIKKMRHGAYLINTARGAVVETAALVQGLHDGKLAGVALDVLEEEAAMDDEMCLLLDKQAAAQKLQIVLANHYLARHPNVIISPHNAYNTIQACQSTWDVTIDNINAFIADKPTNVAKPS
jgi:D-lactate dehydrogenase